MLVSVRTFPIGPVQMNTDDSIRTTIRPVSTSLMAAKVLMHSSGSSPSDTFLMCALEKPRSDTALKVATKAMVYDIVP
ncbi:MAG: hypothetical protein A4E30_00856 [Methanomassiliicoccales archaeon PtaB.Bin215]|nr:MAG: hypothetical protein A4E30_00856 [Methanomassiliicoccales archaeon PtaB.Bin215]